MTNLSILLENLPLQLRLNMWFQQDACPSHTSKLTRAALNAMFPNKWIGKYDQLSTTITRSHRPRLFLRKDKRLGLRTCDCEGQCD